MRKNRATNKENNLPGERGMFYAQRLCSICKKLIVVSNPKSYEAANSDLGRKLKEHKQECQKDKQLNLSMPGSEQKETKSVSRITLRGEEKSV